jgi:hypothetical protein
MYCAERRMGKGLIEHFVDSNFKFLFEEGKTCGENFFYVFKDFMAIVCNRKITLDIRKYGRVLCNPPPPRGRRGKQGRDQPV